MKQAPCAKCERKGCGAYHDECQAYKDWRTTVDAAAKRQKAAKTPRAYEEARLSKDRIRLRKRG